jgi:excisionase family DNA binding protein
MDERLTVAEAAAWLGITEDAVRKRIHKHKIRYERDPDGRYFVYPNEADRRQDRSDTDPQERLIANLEGQNRFLRAQLEAERESNRENRRLLAAALERIPPQLEAPSEPREAPETATAEETERHPGGAQEGAQRPWWRRVFGG